MFTDPRNRIQEIRDRASDGKPEDAGQGHDHVQHEPGHELERRPGRRGGPSAAGRSRPAPYIYTRKDVRKIMTAAQKLGPPGSLRPIVVSTLIGLLYATGLRIGEALNLSGLEVALEGGAKAFIRRADLARDRNDQRPERFGVGDKIDALITQVDKAGRKINLSIKAREVAEEKEAVEQYGSSDSGASLGDILGAALSKAQKKKDE
jgi:integrase